MTRIAACGLDCDACSIYQAANSAEEARKLAEAWRAAGWERAMPEWFRCQGCNGPRDVLWDDGCKIRQCCLEERQHENCSQCGQFPCQHVIKFEEDGNEGHRAAVQSLRQRRK